MPKNTPWPADQVERRAVASLIAYARNSRTHSPAQVDQIASSVREWGWTTPVLIAEDSTILAGHGRVLAAQKLGLKEVPVMVARGWTEAQKRAYVIADNAISLNAGWNEDMLRIELADLQTADFKLELVGFAPGQLADFIAGKDLEPPPFIDGPDATRNSTAPGEDEPEQGGSGDAPGKGSLAVRFGVPPFTVLNAREGWWQNRKRAWLATGIQSELGRGAAPGGAPMPMDRAKGGGRPRRVNDASV